MMMKLIVGLVLISQIFCDDGVRPKGWEALKVFNNNSIEGPPFIKVDPYETVVQLGSEFRTGKEVTMTSGGAKKDFRGCIEMDYYLDTPELFGLKIVHVANLTLERKVIWSRYGFHGDQWHKVPIYLNMKKDDVLEFVGTTDSGTVAISNIHFDHTFMPCEFAYHTTDFEREESFWNASIQTAYSVKNGVRDHTSDSSQGKVAFAYFGNIVPQHTIRDEAKCFTFWYFRPVSPMYNKPAEVKLFVNEQMVWMTHDDTDPVQEWLRVRVPLKLSGNNNSIRIETNNHSSFTPQGVLFDDFVFSESECSPAVDCNFTDGLCGWTHTPEWNTDRHVWSLGEGRVRNISAYGNNLPVPRQPSTIYTDFTQKRPREGIEIKSEFLLNNAEYCATINYLYKNVSQSDLFSLETITTVQSSVRRDNVWIFDALTASKLFDNVYHEATAYVTIPASTRPRRLGFFASGSDPATRFAVKDIKVVDGRCMEATVTPPTTPTPFVPSKLDRNMLVIADEFMKNSRANVQRILELIKLDTDPIKIATEKILNELDSVIQEIARNLK